MTATQAPSILKGLSKRQLAVLEVAAKHDLKFDMSETSSYSFRNRQKRMQVNTAWPDNLVSGERSSIAEEMRRAFGKRWSYSSHDLNQVGTALLRKGLLVEVAEVEPARTVEGTYRSYDEPRVARYALSNRAREAVGGIAVALDDLRAKEAAAVAREKAWDEAVTPLATQYIGIRRRKSELVHALREIIKQDHPAGLIDAHTQYHQIVAEQNELNALLKVVSENHNREYAPYEW